MRRFGIGLSCLLLTSGLVGLTACTGSDRTSPITSAPVVREAGVVEATAGGFGPGQLAVWVLEGVVKAAGGQGYSFLSDLLLGGDDVKVDTTTQKLDGIQSQLDGIDTRLTGIATDVQSIQDDLVDQDFRAKLEKMNGWNNSMVTLYREYFEPIAGAAKEVAAAKESISSSPSGSCAAVASKSASTANTTTGSCTSPAAAPAASTATLAARSQQLETLRKNFQDAFGRADPYTVLANQHDSLYPKSPSLFSVLKLAGRKLESKGYATAADSQQLHNLYLALSDQEALTALLILEHDKMFGTAAVTQRHEDQYLAFRKAEVDNLAQQIPPNKIKVGNRMYAVITEYGTGFGAWLPMDNGQQIGTFNAAATAAKYSGWSLPNDLQLTALYNATKGVPIITGKKLHSDTVATHLGSVFPSQNVSSSPVEEIYADFWQRQSYWSSDVSGLSNPQKCYNMPRPDLPHYLSSVVTKQYTFHHVGNMTAASAIAIQNLPSPPVPENITTTGKDGDPNLCHPDMVRLYNNKANSAGVILVHPVDLEKDNYMAERSTALSAPVTATTATTATTSNTTH